MAQPLGKRIEEWFYNLPLVGRGIRMQEEIRVRRMASNKMILESVTEALKAGKVGRALGVFLVGFYDQIFGDMSLPLRDLKDEDQFLNETLEQIKANPSAFIGDHLRELTGSAAIREISESVGALVMDPVIGLFESYADNPNPDPHEFSRAFHGYMMSLSWAGAAVETPLRVVLGDRTPPIKDLMTSMYWTMGLGFLGWQTLAPLLSTGLQPNLERYYNRKFRPARFSPSQASDIFALGKQGIGWLQDYLRDQGWREEDIQTWIELSYRSLSEGTYWDLYEEGTISKDRMDEALRAAGYNPKDFDLLYKSHEPEAKTETTKFLISTVKAAYKDGRMGVDEFRAILSEQNYSPVIIDLLIEQLDLERNEEEKQVTETNIKLLYNTRVIGGDEASHHLQELGYTADIAGQLIDAWDRQALPKPARINKDTILEAMVKGVFTEGQAQEKLQQEAGFTADQAKLLVQIELAPFPEKVTPPEVQAVSLSMLADFVQAGLVTRGELEGRSELANYSQEDRERVITLLFQQPTPATTARELPQGIIEEAYVFGFITRDDLLSRLEARGFTPEDAELAVKTLEAENPGIFGDEAPVLVRLPSVGALQLALQRGLIDEAGFRQRLSEQGYSEDAITIFTFNAQYQLPATPRLPTKSDVTGWVKDQVISRAEYQRRMLQLGYLSTDIELYLQELGLAIEDTQAFEWFKAGFIDVTGFLAIIEGLGFTADEIQEFLALLEAGEV